MFTQPIKLLWRRRRSLLRSISHISLAIICIPLGAVPALAVDAESTPPDPTDLTELSLEELATLDVVYAASRYEQSPAEAPAAVTIVTADEIKKAGYRSLGEILDSVGGFYTTYDRNYEYVGVRGFGRPGDYNTGILLLVNGHRLNDNLYDAASIGLEFPLNIDLINRVEVVRGPASSLYGTSAFLAVVNVITKSVGEGTDFEIAVAGASYDTRETRVSYGTRFDNGVEFLASATVGDSDGQTLFFPEFADPESNNGMAVGADGSQHQSFFTQVSFRNFMLEAAAVSFDKTVPTASYETVFNDNRTRTVDEAAYLNLSYEHFLPTGLGLLARASLNRYVYDGVFAFDYAEEEDEEPYIVLNQDYSRGDWLVTELQLSKEFSDRNRAIFGAEYRDNMSQDQGNYDEEIYLDARRSSHSWGVYGQDEISIGENLTLFVGLRHDHYDTFGGSTNPRAALVWEPISGTALKLLHGSAFRAPNAYELYYHDGEFTTKASLELEPEEIETYEVVWEQQLGSELRGRLSLYHYDIENLISLITDPEDDLLVFTNVDTARAEGAELELQGKWKGGVDGRLSYAYQESEDGSTGEILVNSPRHLAKLRLTSPLFHPRLYSTLSAQFTDTRATPHGGRADSSTRVDLTFTGTVLQDQFELSLSAYNLLDEEIAHPASEEHTQDVIYQDGRSWRLVARFRF